MSFKSGFPSTYFFSRSHAPESHAICPNAWVDIWKMDENVENELGSTDPGFHAANVSGHFSCWHVGCAGTRRAI